jgi:hypothetical protein
MTMTTQPDIEMFAVARFFGRREKRSVLVDRETGDIRVWDDVAKHYTLVHSLSESAQQRIRRLAAAASVEA